MAADADSGSAPFGDLQVSSRLTIPAAELEESFQTTGGPGGQHANRSATGVTLTWRYATSSAITDDEREQLAAALGRRGAAGVLRVVADKSRSQWRNRSLARSRLARVVRDALRPTTPRRATKPSKAARQRRLTEKKHRAETKRLRRPPPAD